MLHALFYMNKHNKNIEAQKPHETSQKLAEPIKNRG